MRGRSAKAKQVCENFIANEIEKKIGKKKKKKYKNEMSANDGMCQNYLIFGDCLVFH